MDSPPFDYGKWRFFFELFLFFWNIALGVWLWMNRSHKELSQRIAAVEKSTHERIDGYEERCSAKKERITRLESQVKELPNHNDLGRIYDRINAVGGDLREMKGILDGTAKSVERLHRYLLDHDRG